MRPKAKAGKGSWKLGLLLGSLVLLILLGILAPRVEEQPVLDDRGERRASGERTNSIAGEPNRTWRRSGSTGARATAEEIVADKLSRFARHRLELVEEMARHYKLDVSDDVRRFFAAAEAGRWEEVQALFESLKKQSKSREQHVLWGPLVEVHGVMDQAQQWPAQRLLDYGRSILDSLRPGMVYVGGTDSGRFIPTLLNETSEGPRHVILTQNAFADGTYLEYAALLYADSLRTLSPADSQRAFQEYLQDAQKRLLHDQDFPADPKQVRAGEDIQIKDNRVQVSGQVAVMSINEKLLQFLMDKNPETSFAIEQSFPLASTYGEASPLGPIMELKAQADPLTPERASQSLDYWRELAPGLASETDGDLTTARKAYSKLAIEQATLFSHHQFPAEAEQLFQLAAEICPNNHEAVARYARFLVEQKRSSEALLLAENAARAAPGNTHFQALVQQIKGAP